MNDISAILAQIRSLQSQVGVPGKVAETAPAQQAPAFAETLQNALGQVNRSQHESRKLAEAFELGDPRADLVKVMMAAQESQLAFRATVEVRNKLVQAYQDVMNMPL